MLVLELQNFPDTTVVRCSGRIVRGNAADALLRTVMSREGKRHFQIDLTGVTAIDAGGLGVLVVIERWAGDTDRTIQLINPTSIVREALDATHLSAVLNIRRFAQESRDNAPWGMQMDAAAQMTSRAHYSPRAGTLLAGGSSFLLKCRTVPGYSLDSSVQRDSYGRIMRSAAAIFARLRAEF